MHRSPGFVDVGHVGGDVVLNFLDGYRASLDQGLSKSDEPGCYNGIMTDYQRFAAVLIWTENGAYAMVGLDAPAQKSLDEGDFAHSALDAEVTSAAFEVLTEYGYKVRRGRLQ